jgi:hypothetical protein
MPARPKKYNVPLSLRFIADWEQRVSRQMLLIARLKMKGRPTKDAETILTGYQAALMQLRNHAQVMREMMNSEPTRRGKGDPQKDPTRIAMVSPGFQQMSINKTRA